MNERDWLADKFESHREHLRGVAYRMLGSRSEADDAVQESWLHVTRSGADGVQNMAAWLTTIVGRVCLDMLRARKARREEPMAPGEPVTSSAVSAPTATDPEREMALSDSVGVALLVMLDTLAPSERVALVLHDFFAIPFEDIATILEKSPEATRQLASRARRRMQGTEGREADLAQRREIVARFLNALRSADFEALVSVLDPDLVVRADAAVLRAGSPTEVRGAHAWAKSAIGYGGLARITQLALIDGVPGLVVAPKGRVVRVLRCTFAAGRIASLEILADPASLSEIEVTFLDE